MSYILGDITLPTPQNFKRSQVETGVSFKTLSGTTKKDITNRKEIFELAFNLLTQAEVTQILSEFNLQTTRNFTVSETNLTIPTTPVHITITKREYNAKGSDYREDITLVLEEVI